ncbi:MAG: GTPase [Leptolyngbya sp. SIO4C1]|nr:GTPase [Leptolyngbya sp. SIO4C1]
MEIMKLVVTGPVGAGKSTFIRAVSEIEVVDTDRQATDETGLLKSKTTVAFDFGRLQFGPEMALHLYGTPGQARFDFMWEDLINKAHAYILLVPAHRPSEFRKAHLIYRFMIERAQLPMVVGVTHLDCEEAWPLENIEIALGFTDKIEHPPFIPLNATEPASVIRALMILINQYIQARSVCASQ